MHQVGELFIEGITEVAYDLVVAEASDHGKTEDPRRVGGPGGEPTIINLQELRRLLLTQQSLEDQTV